MRSDFLGMNVIIDESIPEDEARIVHDGEIIMTIKNIDTERKKFPPPKSELGEPKKKFSETFSFVDAMKQSLIEKLKEKSQTDSPFLGTNFDYK